MKNIKNVVVMKKANTLVFVFAATILMSCSNNLLDSNTKKDVEARLSERTWLPEYKTDEMTGEEKQAMDFLYAWLSVADCADFSSDLFYQNVKSSLQARKELKWNVPDDLFLHFVLPVRINNENLDYSRIDFYGELKDRVKGLTMEQAILEVNHWCHEKAVYTPDDSRTLSPSAMVSTAMGRCGEESTFCVAALRSVGIPARQIYTPRWAHTDDNHAWVEAWADGKWHFLGACEPDARLDHGWFSSPAKRGLIMFTKVFGKYNGDEEVISRTDGYTEINVTDNYAPVKKHFAKIIDSNGNIVVGANVHYSIYNYGEFYPAVKKESDENGITSMNSGLGDMYIWAYKDGVYGFSKIDPRATDTAIVVIDKTDNDIYSYDIDLVPPVELPVTNSITREESIANGKRLAKEDSIRNAYVNTFIKEDEAKEFARNESLDENKVWHFLKNSRGNWNTIKEFISTAQNKEKAIMLLENISIKDLKDTPIEVLNDHLTNSNSNFEGSELYAKYVLSPRIDDELITGYKGKFQKIHCGSIEKIIEIIGSIQLRPELNPAKLKMMPEGVVKIRIADKKAIERTAIALMRSAGIPSRREPISEKPQYYEGNDWKYIPFPQLKEVEEKVEGTGNLLISFDGSEKTKDPHYYTHFTISKITNGIPRLIEPESSSDIDMGDDGNVQIIGNEISMPIGTYELVTGTRMADGTVLSHCQLFTIKEGETTPVKLLLRQNNQQVQVIGNIDAESLYIPEGESKPTSILSTTGRGYFILALIDSKKEPTTHMLRAFEAIKDDLNKWDRKIVLILQDEESLKEYKKEEFPNLPGIVCYGYDDNGKTTAMLKTMLKADITRLPVLIVADSFGRVVYTSTGYNTSTSEQISRIISQLNSSK